MLNPSVLGYNFHVKLTPMATRSPVSKGGQDVHPTSSSNLFLSNHS
ncbi:hypothetical protein LC605_07645 [Nostoc sp. CHAB 5836]|nr:hypothetical protein [Nostoc sp. CHAB 5836]MCC5614950.1 hypothetical protein [Nostoc sp. CHAB 5836]